MRVRPTRPWVSSTSGHRGQAVCAGSRPGFQAKCTPRGYPEPRSSPCRKAANSPASSQRTPHPAHRSTDTLPTLLGFIVDRHAGQFTRTSLDADGIVQPEILQDLGQLGHQIRGPIRRDGHREIHADPEFGAGPQLREDPGTEAIP